MSICSIERNVTTDIILVLYIIQSNCICSEVNLIVDTINTTTMYTSLCLFQEYIQLIPTAYDEPDEYRKPQSTSGPTGGRPRIDVRKEQI